MKKLAVGAAIICISWMFFIISLSGKIELLEKRISYEQEQREQADELFVQKLQEEQAVIDAMSNVIHEQTRAIFLLRQQVTGLRSAYPVRPVFDRARELKKVPR